jgi:hypothetical protein
LRAVSPPVVTELNNSVAPFPGSYNTLVPAGVLGCDHACPAKSGKQTTAPASHDISTVLGRLL